MHLTMSIAHPYSPETVGAQGGVLGDGVIELHNLESGGDEPKLKGCVNQGPTCLK